MKGKLKLTLLCVLTFVLALSLFGFVGCAGNGNGNSSQDEKVNPPEKLSEVTAITLSYNGDVINGMLTADLSLKTLDLSVRVDGDEGADKTVKYSSENEKIASVDRNGKVILKRAGETMITATAMDVSAKFVLVVGSGDALSYTVTVNGGRADKTTAAEGEYVKLTPEVPAGKQFVEWSFSAGVTWTNGSSFRMPATSVTATAVFKDVLYTLNVIGATVKRAGTSMNPVGEYLGNTKDGDDPAYSIMKYEVAHESEVVIEPITVSGKAFVGFDKDVKNNRVGDVANGEYVFNMDATDVTLTAIYSQETKETFALGTQGKPYSDAKRGFKAIRLGVVDGESKADPDLNGANGYRFAIPGHTAGQPDVYSGIKGFETKSGTKLAFVTFKNNHEKFSVTVEWFLNNRGAGMTTGKVTIGPKEVKKVICEVAIGINTNEKPWSGFYVRKAVGASSSDTVLLDMTVSSATQYPDGDKSLSVVGDPQKVEDIHFEFGQNVQYRNACTISDGRILSYCYVGGLGGSIKDIEYAYTSGFHGELLNLPEFDPENPTVNVYMRAINNGFMDNDVKSGFKIAFAKDENFKEIIVEKVYSLKTPGDIELFKFEIPRTKDGKIYLSFSPNPESDAAKGWYSAIFQYFYNDVIGYEE